MLEFNPTVLAMANRYLQQPLTVAEAKYVVPRTRRTRNRIF